MTFTIHPFGDRALLLQWEQRIDPGINTAVVQLSEAIQRLDWPGVAYCQPAYCSLTIGFQPERISYQALTEAIRNLVTGLEQGTTADVAARQVVVPVCYEGEMSPDLTWMSQYTGLTEEQIVQLHTGTPFRVFMLGFLPGFPYLGILPKVLEMPRKETPRVRVPAGSVALAGLQTGIYPLESPGGWQIIGRTPWQVFDPNRASPFLLQPGDEVRFRAISEKDFQQMKDSPML